MKKVLIGLIAVFIIVAGVAICSGVVLSGGSSEPVLTPPTTYSPPKAGGSKGAAPAKDKNQIGQGTWEVGVDVEAGKYRTTGALTGDFTTLCYWDVRKGSEAADIDVQGVVDSADQPGRVTLSKGQFFTTRGCEDWAPVG